MENRLFLTIKEASELVGVHRTVIDSLIKREKIPYARLSQRVVRFDREQLIQWVRSGGLNADSQEAR